MKPRLSFLEILNMSMGFFGIQFGFALQNANASRILMTFGVKIDEISLFWLVAPITGMLIQPIVGYLSDKTWTRLGRRRPYFLAGAFLTSIALILMPNSPSLSGFISPMFVGGGLLMLMDASINISMEPFRALVADKLPENQHTLGFSVQTVLIGMGAVIGSSLPYLLEHFFNINAEAVAKGQIPDNVSYSFYIGAAVLISSILITVMTTNEYPPEPLEQTTKQPKEHFRIPRIMMQLLLVQFFSWFAFFSMWVYTTPAVALHYYHTTDASSSAFQQAGNWVNILFCIYNGTSALIAFLLPVIAKKLNKKTTHALALTMGAIAMISIPFIASESMLEIPMIGIGIAWGSVLAMPYAMLAGSIPPKRMGLYIGLFNMSITIPQIVSGLSSGLILKYFFANNPVYCLVLAGVSLLIAAAFSLLIKEKEENEKLVNIPE